MDEEESVRGGTGNEVVMDDPRGEEHVMLQGENTTSSGQHVAVFDENGDTIYVQLPPNITLDGNNSIIMSEVTDDGQQVFRILGVAENQVRDVVAEDVPMEQDENNMVIMDGAGHQDMLIIKDANTTPLAVEAPEVDMMVSADQQQPSGEVLSFVEATQEVEADVQQVSETEVIEGQSELGQSKVTNLVVDGGQAVDEAVLSGTQVVGDTGDNQQDLALFQQALALLHQQSGGNVVITDRDDTIYIMQQDVEDGGANTTSRVLPEGNTLPEGDTVVTDTPDNLQDTAGSSDIVNIINPETGDFEAIPRSALDTVPDQMLPRGAASATDPSAETDRGSTPIIIKPRRRRPGRPRKNQTAAKLPPPKPQVEEEDEPVELGASGRPRRKAAIKMLQKWEAMRKEDDGAADERVEPTAISRKPPAPSSTQSLRAANKENIAPKHHHQVPPPGGNSDHAASVTVTFKDSTARQVLSDIGIHMLYYCRRCTFFSTQLMTVANHIHECREQLLTDADLLKAADSAHTSTLLLNASLHSIAGSGRGNAAPGLSAGDEDLIEIDEHNYAAEVDIIRAAEDSVADDVPDVMSAVADPTEVLVECHLCALIIGLSKMEDHLRNLHVDVDVEEAVKAVQAAVLQAQANEEVAHQMAEVKEETPDVDLAQTVIDYVQEITDMASTEPVETPIEATTEGDAEATAAVATVVPEDEQPQPEVISDNIKMLTDQLADADPASTAQTGVKFRCPQHELMFTTKAALTQHYIEVHWEVTEEKVKAAEQKKELEKQHQNQLKQQQQQMPPVKRSRGRPRKIRPQEAPMDDDDVKDPDFEVGYRAFLPQFRVKVKPDSAKCKICYKRFASLVGLDKHIEKSHTGDKLLPLPCPHCNKLFKNQVQQRNHIRTVHEGKKRKYVYRHYPKYKRKTLMCELCGYTTPELCRLKNHKKSVHEGDYPYKCDTCDYKTNENADMRRHMHKHQGIKRYPCQFCTYRTDQRWLLVNHCQRQHGIQLEKQSRNTRGSVWSNQRRRKDDNSQPEDATTQMAAATTQMAAPSMVTLETDSGLAFTQEIVIEQGMGDFYVNPQDGCLVPMVANQQGDEVAMYTVHNNGTEEQITIETIEEETHGGEVVYIQEDGTVLDQDQAALMLLAVGPGAANVTQLDMDSAVQLETNYT